MDIKSATKEDLEKELEARRLAEVPQPLPNINWSEVIGQAIKVRDGIAENGYGGKDRQHYMFEAVMLAVFGKNYFNWHNEYDMEG